ncbi:MAG TPA: VCBS repeat-containing protein [Phycisphaerae bacterium]|nr:VCBS repeat-containing protein [Phycisphaerae bacterium]
MMNSVPCCRAAAGAGLGLTFSAALATAWLSTGAPAVRPFPAFEDHKIAEVGRRMGQTSLVDVDRDGDLDWVTGCGGGGDTWWFEYQAPDKWVQHLIGGKARTDVGGTAFDVDGDGWVDQISGGTWYRNTGKPRQEPFQRFDNGAISTHDNVMADVDGDGKLDVVAMSDKQGLWWYRIPPDPTRPWPGVKIGPGVHGGVDPRGVGDLDGDGDNDVVRSTGWFENADGKGTKWTWHANIDGARTGRYPDTTKSWVLDLDGDGDNDIVMTATDAEAGTGWVKRFENADGKGGRWVPHVLADRKGDLHSLALADFDNDGDMDVFSGEGPLGGSGPEGKHRWFIWENLDGKGTRWAEHVVLEGKRCHEAKAADVDGDGDVDLCSKPWNGALHVYLRNLLRETRAERAKAN